MKLNGEHIRFVLDGLRENTTRVRNIKQYLRAMLFNAPSTISNYYTALVAHDMAQPDWGKSKSGLPDGSCGGLPAIPLPSVGERVSLPLAFLRYTGSMARYAS